MIINVNGGSAVGSRPSIKAVPGTPKSPCAVDTTSGAVVGSGVEVGSVVAVAVGVFVGAGVSVGSGVGLGEGVSVGSGVSVATIVSVGAGMAEGSGWSSSPVRIDTAIDRQIMAVPATSRTPAL